MSDTSDPGYWYSTGDGEIWKVSCCKCGRVWPVPGSWLPPDKRLKRARKGLTCCRKDFNFMCIPREAK